MEKKELKKYLILAAIVVIICFIVKYIAFVGQFILIRDLSHDAADFRSSHCVYF